ncbi:MULTISPECIES: MlaD family protein [Delftia]|jgi:phospholipid/cholesterol/gamma-HCH transport system substrate-binding protein|uniref:MlaD family protein n=3 Tax=Pseudomonadati TaxID=3379134 RepID=A0AAJ2R8B5_DELAC|nr:MULTISPECIES: MlaD family protein [Delftia]PIF35077.1 phospholipid/cholesterol/gamma-HCH transport system substrate-binding protein [Burkholderiales bacterium 23]AEF87418.1 Mammalian cell entry related domain protein [Delftia sp. Cs1-4]APE46548.1 mammalian cell entry protein [Delftia sp. HK171]ATH12511.1 MCE family protein [Delftia acidovorans]KFJ13670.1 mce related family protein [Delftia acidovorans]
MENKSHAMAAGIFVLVVAALLAGLAIWLTRDTRQYNEYELSTKDGISGLQAQAAVRYKGVAVGKVTRIGFDPQTNGNVLIRIAIGVNTPITPTTFAVLGYQGVTGLAHVQLDDADQPQPQLPPGPSGLPRLPLRSSPLSMLADQGQVLLERADEISRRLSDMLDTDNQKRVSQALENIAAAAAGVQQLTQNLDRTLSTQVPQLAADAHNTLQSLEKASNGASAVASELQQTVRRVNAQDGPLEQIAQSTRALTRMADSLGRSTVPHANRAADDVSRAARQMGTAASRFSDNPQAVIYGPGQARPGPGEPGFVAPSAATQP